MYYKIPNENNKYYVSNASDLIPNIQYVKNIDMDEEGYLKLSPPFPKITSRDDEADWGVFADALYYGDGSAWGLSTYKFITDDKIYDVHLNSLTVTVDASAPGGDSTARFSGWKSGTYKKRAYTETNSDIWSFEASYGSSPGTQTWKKNNGDGGEFNETFVNRNTFVVSSSYTIQQYTEADMDETTPPSTNSGQTLTIPSNFTITGMAYSNYRMGIATINDAVGPAYFFVWDGSTSDASMGFPVNAESIIDLIPYRNSWALLTSAGQLLLFNGGGFDILGNLPIYYQNIFWVSGQVTHGRTMFTDGDVIYFNLGTEVLSNDDDSGLVKGFYSGVWCYDPDLGCIYHRYGLSHSQIYKTSLTAVDGVFTSTAHLLETGDKVRYTNNKIYYAIKLTADTFKLANSYDDAIDGTATSDSVTHDIVWIKRTDWSQLTAHNNSFGAFTKFNDRQSMVYSGVYGVFAGLLMNTTTLAATDTTCVMAPVFDNIGTICYSKVKAKRAEDLWNSIDIKHSKLKDGDKIIVKVKTNDDYKQIAVGEANDATPEVYVSWTASNTFTTTKNITDVNVGDEVEFYQGAGAGSTAHIVSKTLVGSTWTVVLDENIRGGVSGNKSTCIFDSFKKIGEITKDTEGHCDNQVSIPLDQNYKNIQIKIELRGNNFKIEELMVTSIKDS